MRKLKDVLRLKLDACLSHQQIATAVGISKGVVTKYVGLAAAAGLDWAAVLDPDESTLERHLLIGPACAEAITRLMAENKHPEHGYRSSLGLLSLAKRYGRQRLEAACTRALQIGACQYRHVHDILKSKHDQIAPAANGEWISPDHTHVRGPGYYQ